MSQTISAPEETSTRDAILGVALELFGQGGYQKTSLRDIAEKMGFTKAALYYHYPTKEELLGDLFAPVMAAGDELVARHSGSKGPSQRVEFLGEYFDFLYSHRLLLCHIACDLAVLSTPEIGGRVVGHVEAVVNTLAGGSASQAKRTRAKSALGALQAPITLSEPSDDMRLVRRIAVESALAALAGS